MLTKPTDQPANLIIKGRSFTAPFRQPRTRKRKKFVVKGLGLLISGALFRDFRCLSTSSTVLYHAVLCYAESYRMMLLASGIEPAMQNKQITELIFLSFSPFVLDAPRIRVLGCLLLPGRAPDFPVFGEEG